MNTSLLNEIKTVVADEEVTLLSERAMILHGHFLLVSDLHFGKIDHFRKNGIGLPPQSARDDIHKLEALIKKTNPQEVIFLGDLFHSEFNNAWDEFKNVILSFKDTTFTLVVGNHDILDPEKYNFLNVVYQLEIRNFILTHEPMDTIIEGKYNLCGHIHPGVKLKGRAKQSLRLPCFYFGENVGILPAFGTFTGIHVIKPLDGDQVFVLKDEIIVQVS